MSTMEKIGAFALTEPDHGSDSIALATTARRDGDHWVLDGDKRWIGNATIADLVVVWARDTDDGQVKGFVVETPAEGYEATVMTGKLSLRAVWQADIALRGVRVPDDNRLAEAQSFRDTGRGARHHPLHLRVDGAGPRDRGLRRRAHLRQAAHPVRQAAGVVPDRAAAPGADAGRAHRHAALLHADRAPRRRRASSAPPWRAWRR